MMYRIILIGALLLLIAGCDQENSQAQVASTPEDKQETHSGYTQQMKPVLTHYLKLRDALVTGNTKKATDASAAFGKAVGQLDIRALDAENKQRWMIRGADLSAKGSMLVTKRSLEEQRKAFYSLSKALIAALKDMGNPGIKLYVQHCPMAFNDTGADWISDSDKVVNPYFGDEMLHCGSVKGEL
ncbi:MAG: DUF3347 domain-containing protein [Calditrichota bacterium]